MCMEEDKAKVVSAIFASTSTLGVREKTCLRYMLSRRIEEVALPDGSSVRRKVASGHGVSRAKWESDDIAALAAEFPVVALPYRNLDTIDLNNENVNGVLSDATFADGAYLGGSKGEIVIPSNTT